MNKRDLAEITLLDIEGMIESKLARARREWEAEDLPDARMEGQRFGFTEGRADVQGAVDDIVNRELNHISRHLTNTLRKRTTIKAEREWMAQQAASLDRAIAKLRRLTGDPR